MNSYHASGNMDYLLSFFPFFFFFSFIPSGQESEVNKEFKRPFEDELQPCVAKLQMLGSNLSQV